MKKDLSKFLTPVAGALLLVACATPDFPETGEVTPYDGMWMARLPAEQSDCKGVTAKFEVRYGMAIGTVVEGGRRVADIWGEIDADGRMDGLVGQLGITGATATIDFQPKTASGTWSSEACTGTVDAQKVG